MKNKHLLLLLLMAMFAPLATQAYNHQVQVGHGTSGQNIAPMNIFFNYSYTQQIYTAAQINEGCNYVGDIESISFYYASSTTRTVPITVFMKTTEKTAFASTTDWETVTANDIVYEGDFTVSTAGWVTIPFDEPFAYDGESNLLIAINKGMYTTYANLYFNYTPVDDNQVIHTRTDNGSGYDPNNPGIASSLSHNLPNILFNMTIAHLVPSAVTLDDVSGYTATLSWTAPTTTNTITGYAYEYTDGETVWTGTTPGTTANITNLTPETEYLFYVKAIYGDGESCWADVFDFFTLEACPTPRNLAANNITARSAEISWFGSGADSYTVQKAGGLGSTTETVTLLSEGFEDGFIPGNWATDPNGSYNWTVGTGTGNSMYTSAATGSYNAYFYPNTMTYPATSYLITPAMDMDAVVSATLSFNYINPDWSGGQDELHVYYRVNGGEWHLLASFTSDQTSWTSSGDIELTGFAANYQIGFYGTNDPDSDYGRGIGIDDVEIVAETRIYEWITVDNNASNPYTYNDLDPETTYRVRVFGVCNGKPGEPSNILSFTTIPSCLAPTDLTFSDVTTHTVTLSWTNEDEGQTAWQILCLIDNDEIYIVNADSNPFILTNLFAETNYTLKVRANCGEEDGTSSWSNEVSFTTDIPCPALTNLAVSDITNNSATIAWDGAGVSYALQYGIVSASKDSYSDDGWYYYDNGTYGTSFGIGEDVSFSWGVMFPAGSFDGDALTKVMVYDYDTEMTGTVTIYSGGDDAPGTAIGSQDITLTGANDWIEIDFGQLSIDVSENVWVIVNNASGAAYPAAMSVDDNGDANGRWVEIYGDWYDVSEAGVPGYSFMVRAKFEMSFDPSTISWITVDNATNPQELTELEASTKYAVRVRAYCGIVDGYSEWTMTTFTTLSNCAVPTNLTTTGIPSQTTILNWSGIQENYNVRYRKPLLFEGFEGGIPSTWTTIDSDGDGNNWFAFSELGTLYPAHAGQEAESYVYHGNNAAMSSSAYNNASGNGYTTLNSDQWLITPQVNLGGTLEFYVKTIGSYGDAFEVLLSTSGNEIENFTTTLREMTAATPNWTEVNISLSDYEGQGYIAIHHVKYDGFFLVVDDFAIYDEESWIYMNDISGNVGDNTLTIENLTANTQYAWQVQGINESCDGGVTEWSETATFFTMPSFTKEITGYSNGGGWNLIASPLAGEIDPMVATNLINTNQTEFDLYRFNQDADPYEWENWKASGTDHYHFNLENGRGYLYGNKYDITLTFMGMPITEAEKTIDLDYTEGVGLAGWNLVGNPFTVEAFTETPYYSIEGSAVVPVETTIGDGISAMEGIFVEATAPGQSITFTITRPAKSPSLVLNLTQGQSLVDRAIVRFDEGSTLSKFQLFENSKLYIPQDGKEYSIVRSESMGELPVNFEATENGTYTLNLSSEEVEFSYLHLIDNVTGDDIDLLSTPSYTFNAQTTDNANRFRLVFAIGSTGVDENFAFFSDGNFIISNEGEATLEVIDITGRTISSESVNGSVSKAINAPAGIYLLRLTNGDNVRVQKVVVK